MAGSRLITPIRMISLGNGLDRILLTSAQGLELDEVAWDNGGFFPDPDGASMQLDGSQTCCSKRTLWPRHGVSLKTRMVTVAT